jgi:PAS domain S-box-containing protein
MAVNGLTEPATRLEFSSTLAQAINAATSVEEAFAATLRLFCQAGGWALGQVWLPDPDGAVLTCGPVWHATTPGLEPFRQASLGLRFTPGMPLVGKVWVEGEVRWAEDIGADRDHFSRADVAAALGLSTGLLVPVVADDQVITVLEFFTHEHRCDDPGLKDLVRSAAAQLGSLMAQKRAETELRLSEARFRAVAETASDAIVSIDSTGLVSYLNAEAARMFGYHPDQLLGSPVTKIVPERFHQAHWAGMARFLATGESRLIGSTVSVPARRSDGSELPVELSLGTWQVDGSRSFSAIIRDVTERHKAHQELERALALEREAAIRLHELDQLKNTLLDVVSHDLRSPLAALQAITAVMQGDASIPQLSVEQRQASLAGLQASADKMRTLLDDLLDLERFATGDTTLQRSAVDLGDLARSVVTEHAAELAGRRVRLHLDPVTAQVDRIKVERIIENLLVNATRHTPAGTQLSISVRNDGETALICVDDTGPGVPTELREAIFERFCQAPGADRTGLGMGLSLVARLTHLHGGHAWVQDAPAGGASFRVQLPLTAPAPHKTALPQGAAPQQAVQPTTLEEQVGHE